MGQMMKSDVSILERPRASASSAAPGFGLRLPSGMLWSIVGLAFLVRLVLIPYGMPLLLYEDEPIYYDHALGFGLGHWDIGYFKKPAFFLYFYGLFYGLGYLYSPLMSWRAYVDAFWADPTYVASIGRLVSVCFAAASVYLLGRIGQRAFGWAVGLAAAFWLAVDLVHVRTSPIVISDIPSLCCLLAATLFALRVAEAGRFRDYLACALAIALTLSFKYNVFSGVLLLVAHGVYIWQSKPLGSGFSAALKMAVSDRKFWRSLLLIPVAFLALNPTVLLDFSTFLAHLGMEKRHMLLRDPNAIAAHWQWMAAFPNIFLKILPVAWVGRCCCWACWAPVGAFSKRELRRCCCWPSRWFLRWWCRNSN